MLLLAASCAVASAQEVTLKGITSFAEKTLNSRSVERYIEIDSRLKRVLAVVKMRGSTHSNELRQFEITDDGIVIGNPVPEYEGILGGRPTQATPSEAINRSKH